MGLAAAGRWRLPGDAHRFDLFVRISLYANFVALPLLAGPYLQPNSGGVRSWALGFGVVHAVVCVLLVRSGVDHYLGKRPRPTRLIAAGAVLTVAGVLAAYLLQPGPVPPDPAPAIPTGSAMATLFLLVGAYVAALSTAVPPRVALAVGALGCAATYAVSAAQGSDAAVPLTVGMATLVLVVVFVFRVSVWTLGVVWELDRARHVEASLAVAEERLRFARDLHDVVGRTLSVVALKAELAAQLAKRGREQAVDEMLEIRGIAQDSLAELRAVVGGYRTADLDVELAGARSLLASAGIECRVIGDGAALPELVQGTLGWVVREGATNVLRHSEARTCTITLRPSSDDMITLTMENDGVMRAVDAGLGNGLVGLAERVAAVGGEVTAERVQPDRFLLVARLPLAELATGKPESLAELAGGEPES